MVRKIIFIVSLLFSATVFAKANLPEELNESLQAAQQQLIISKERSAILQADLKQQNKHLEDVKKYNSQQLVKLTPDDIKQAELDVVSAKALVDGAALSLAQTKHALTTTETEVKLLQKQLQSIEVNNGDIFQQATDLVLTKQSLISHQQISKIEKQHLAVLATVVDTSKKILEVRQQILDLLQQYSQVGRLIQRKQALLALEKRFQPEQREWLHTLGQLNQKLQSMGPESLEDNSERFELKIKILEAQERSTLSQLHLLLARYADQVKDINYAQQGQLSVAALNTASSQAVALQNELTGVKDLLDRKIKFLQLQQQLIAQGYDNKVLTPQQLAANQDIMQEIMDSYNSLALVCKDLLQKVSDYQSTLKAALTKELARRQGLPGFNITAWKELLINIAPMPGLTWRYAHAFSTQLQLALSESNGLQIGLCFLTFFLGIGFAITFKKYLTRKLVASSNSVRSVSSNLITTTLELIRRNAISLILTATLLIILTILEVPVISYKAFTSLIFVWFAFKFTADWARITLLEQLSDVTGNDVKVYRSLRLSLIAGGLLTVGTVLAHELPVAYDVRDFFNRLFMVFLLMVSLLFIKNWRVVPNIFTKNMGDARPYLRRVVILVSVLFPYALLADAIIGILGYVDLAWGLSKYALIFLFLLAVYVIARGLLIDFMGWISQLLIRRVRNGWLWSQAILQPIDKTLRFLLLLTVIATLLAFYGVKRDSTLIHEFTRILHLKLFEAAGANITPLSMIYFVLTIYVLFWAAKWSREFAYRWLFAKTRDAGLRNSLAVFTQYTVLVVIGFIALHVMGFSLQGLTYIITALAVGVGFGLRDLANNFVSGVLLLIERPVRKGDFVTIAGFEGEVSHIGARSLTIITWDHMEVIVPNSGVFSQAFTNWTHGDSIVRSLINIKVDRADDPYLIRTIIMQVFAEHPDVLEDPPPQVYFKELSDALLDFELRYFVNIQISLSRARVRSEILFTVHERFKMFGIKAPHPQQDIYLKKVENVDNDILLAKG